MRIVDSLRCAADCCGCVPIDRAVVDANRHLIDVKYTEMILPSSGDLSYPLTDDLVCVFLDRTVIRCAIYDDRPGVCRKYGDESHAAMFCPHLNKDGEVRTRAQRRRVNRNHQMNWEAVLSQARKATR